MSTRIFTNNAKTSGRIVDNTFGERHIHTLKMRDWQYNEKQYNLLEISSVEDDNDTEISKLILLKEEAIALRDLLNEIIPNMKGATE